MASLAIAAGGAAIGAGIGAAAGGTVLGVSSILFGAQVGFVVGSLVGNLLFGPEVPDQTGPRVNEVNVSTSTYGGVIAIPYGAVTVAANMIWLGQIIERKNTRSVGGKGLGGGGATQTTFEYFANFAAAACEGPVSTIRRIWADNQLLVDLTPDNDGQAYKFDAGNYTIYLGDESQEPDSLIEADLGVGNVPAYRGVAYVVFNELPLKTFGNRIPNIEMEIVSEASPSWTENFDILGADNIDVSGVPQARLMFDRRDPILWVRADDTFFKVNPFGNSIIRKAVITNIAPTDTEVFQDTSGVGLDTDFNQDTFELENDQIGVWENETYNPIVDPEFDLMYIWAGANSISDPAWLLEFDKDFNFTGYGWRTESQNLSSGATGHVIYKEGTLTRIMFVVFQDAATPGATGSSGDAAYIFNAGLLGYGGPTHAVQSAPIAFDENGDEEAFGRAFGVGVSDVPLGDVIPGGPSERKCSNVAFEPNGRRAWTLTWQIDATTGPTIVEVDVGEGKWDKFVALDGNPGGFTDYTATLDLMEWTDALPNETGGISYDTQTGHLIVVGPNTRSATQYFRINPDNWTLEASADAYVGDRPRGIWSHSETASNPNIDGFFWITGDRGAADSVNRTAFIKTTNFEVIIARDHDDGITDSTAVESWNPVVDRRTSSLWAYTEDDAVNNLIRYQFFDDDPGTTIADIISDLADRVGQTPSDIDVTELSGDTLAGFVINSESTGRGAVEPLKLAGAFEVVESDWTLKFLKVDRSSVATVAWDDLGAEPGNKPADVRLREPRTQEKDLPVEISVTALLQSREYLPSTQTARRWRDLGANNSEGKNTIRIPVVFSEDVEIKRIADRVLFSQWSRRQSQEFRTGPKFLDIDPLDVVTIEKRGSGVEADIPSQITETEIGPGGVIAFNGRTAEPFLFTDAAVEPSTPVPTDESSGTGIPIDSPTRGFFWDVPPIPDFTVSGVPLWGASPLLTDSSFTWSGASLLRSVDGTPSSFQTVASTDVALPSFKIVSTFPAADVIEDNWNAFNSDLSVTIEMLVDDTDPVTTTLLEVLNGANIAVIGTEVIQYQDVTGLGDRRFTLSNILRGRFGTETEMQKRLQGTVGFLVDAEIDALQSFSSADTRGQERFYKSVTFGRFSDQANTKQFSHTARSLKPLSPTGLKGSVDGSGNKTITWLRRTRFGGPWANGTGRVPLNEAVEEYDVEIFKVGTVIRTFDGLNNEKVQYDKADYDSDFPASEQAESLYENLGFEDGNLDNWEIISGIWEVVQSNLSSSPDEGDFFITTATGIVNQRLRRNLDVSELSIAGNASIEVNARANSESGSESFQVQAECLDRNGNTLASSISSITTTSANTWTTVGSGSITVPEDTVTLRITLIANADNMGFDDIQLSVTRSSTGKVAATVYQISDTVGRGQPRKRIV